jgi:hypothetical protein
VRAFQCSDNHIVIAGLVRAILLRQGSCFVWLAPNAVRGAASPAVSVVDTAGVKDLCNKKVEHRPNWRRSAGRDTCGSEGCGFEDLQLSIFGQWLGGGVPSETELSW